MDTLFDNERIELIFCDEILVELIEVTARPKFRKYFTIEDVALVFDVIEHYAIFITVNSNVTICRDAKDNFLLSLAKDASADYLITGDADLLILKAIDTTKILTIKEFQDIMSEKNV
jgi:putative PIN family toxin of toxin-antitoxin system